MAIATRERDARMVSHEIWVSWIYWSSGTWTLCSRKLAARLHTSNLHKGGDHSVGSHVWDRQESLMP